MYFSADRGRTMKKKIIVVISFLLLIVLGVVIYGEFQSAPIWEANAQKLKESTLTHANDTTVSLTNITPFKWDTVYTFAPYTSTETIYRVIGYNWDNISETVNEGMNQVVFLYKGKVVCYVYGYSENLGYGFDFGSFEGDHLQLMSSSNPMFTVKSAGNIVYLSYRK
jgi:hypothetical protein